MYQNLPDATDAAVTGLLLARTRGEFQIPFNWSSKYDIPAWRLCPTGGVEAGESLQHALLREADEESGLVLDPDTITPLGEPFRKKSKIPGHQWHFQHLLVAIVTSSKNFKEVVVDGDETLHNQMFPVSMVRRSLEHGVSMGGHLLVPAHVRMLERAIVALPEIFA